jgi:sugar lactone lactonase YvrE
VVALLGVGATLTILDDDEGATDVVTRPDVGTTTTTATTDGSSAATTGATSTTTATSIPPAPRPDRVLVATDDGRLLLLEVATGDVALALGTFDVELDPPEGSPTFVDDVAITADGGTVYVSRCCEPASGWISSIPADGSIPLNLYSLDQHFGTAAAVRPGPLARPLLAVAEFDGIDVTSGDPYPADVLTEGGELHDGLAWSPDGARLVWQQFTGSAVVVAEVHGEDNVEVVSRFQFPAGERWSQPVFRRDGAIVVVEQPDGGDDAGETARVLDADTGETITTFPLPGPTISLGYDPTGTWLLVLLDDGRLFGMGGDETFVIAEGITAADW